MADKVHGITKKKDIHDVETYLRNAKTKDFAPQHGPPSIDGCLDVSNGRYIAGLFIQDWGVDPPSPEEVLVFFQEAVGVEDSEDDDDEDQE
ncbi:uncharacterized protein FFNC_15263 [Fusarium fujikuroi]|nr:uncharacterized protein FFM5_15117 [Fusarium fujikuroi]SCO53934.1 uncharacterized protein FFNC_15263 [Fusarium fujikuroi]